MDENTEATAQEKLGAAMDMASHWRETVTEFTKGKPLTALLVAASAGFALRMMTRASRR